MNQSNQDNQNNNKPTSDTSNMRALLIAGTFVLMFIGLIVYEVLTKK